MQQWTIKMAIASYDANVSESNRKLITEENKHFSQLNVSDIIKYWIIKKKNVVVTDLADYF